MTTTTSQDRRAPLRLGCRLLRRRLLGCRFLRGGLLRRGFLRRGLLGGLLRRRRGGGGGRLLRGRLLGTLARRRRTLGALLREHLARLLDRQRADLLATPQRRVVLAVRDVRAEAAVLDGQRLVGQRVVAHFAQRGGRFAPATDLRGRQQRQRLVEGDGEQPLLV